jgi:hypothetical protein
VIDLLLASFRARRQVYGAHNGESLNGHWREVQAASRSIASSSRTEWNRIKLNSILLKVIGTMKKLQPVLQLDERETIKYRQEIFENQKDSRL